MGLVCFEADLLKQALGQAELLVQGGGNLEVVLGSQLAAHAEEQGLLAAVEFFEGNQPAQ